MGRDKSKPPDIATTGIYTAISGRQGRKGRDEVANVAERLPTSAVTGQ